MGQRDSYYLRDNFRSDMIYAKLAFIVFTAILIGPCLSVIEKVVGIKMTCLCKFYSKQLLRWPGTESALEHH